MDLALYQQAGSQPIAGAAPQGTDVREDPRFEALQQTLAALSSPQANMQVDWDRTAELAAGLLTEAGKDLLVASYLAGALLQKGGLPGLAEGLGLMADMVEQYWPTMYPPLARVRGRRNALQWLLDRIDRVAEEQRWESLDPQPADLIALLHMQAARLEQVLGQQDPEGPSLHGLLSTLARLPMQEVAEDAVTTLPAALGSAGPLASPESAVVVPDVPDAPAPGDGASLEMSVAATQDHLFRVADALLGADATDARAYRLNRLAAWMDFTQLPPDNGGLTRIAAPLNEVVSAATRLREGGLDAEMVRFAEAQLPAFPCWLDLQCWAATALGRLGEPYAAARLAVQAATRAWLIEFPGLASERFANGMPFASETSAQWLESLGATDAASGAEDCDVASAPRAGTAIPGGTTAATLARTRTMALNGELDAAIALIQAAITDARSAEDRLRARIALCDMFSTYRPGAVWQPLAQAIVDDIDHHDLEVWDPALAVAGWTAAYAVFRRDSEQAEQGRGQDQSARLLARIAQVDARLALPLLDLP